jgi:[acyl-carrier-protein] S-malonyltransferase
LIVAMEIAQVSLLEEVHGVVFANARLVYGYSLGELAALTCCKEFGMDQALEIPLAMSRDCAELANNVSLGVLFSRGRAIDYDNVQRLCLRVNSEGKGVIGVSAILSPNTILLMGQHQTVDRYKEIMHSLLPDDVHLRPNPNNWPPLHTPIMWERCIPNRSAQLMHTMTGGYTVPHPPILSLVTGKTSYNDFNTRETLHHWVDHPQRLWDAVYGTLATGVETVVHVGPEPNLIPATFKRLSDNITLQASGRSLGSFGLRAMSGLANRQWLANILPSRTALLRAPRVQHIILEDWLLEQKFE